MLTCVGCRADLRPSARICLQCGRAVTESERQTALGVPPASNEGTREAASSLPPYFKIAPDVSPASQVLTDGEATTIRMRRRRSGPRVLVGSIAALGALGLLSIIGIYGQHRLPSWGFLGLKNSSTDQRDFKDQVGTDTNAIGRKSLVENDSQPLVAIQKIDKEKIGAVLVSSDKSELLTRVLKSFDEDTEFEETLSSIEVIGTVAPQGDIEVAKALNAAGLRLFRQEKYEEAIGEFTAALEANPVDAEAMNNLAYAQLKIGDFLAAESKIGEVLAIAPRRSIAWANLGEVYAKNDQLDAAAAAFVVSYKLSPDKKRTTAALHRTAKSKKDETLGLAISMAISVIARSSETVQ